MRSRSTRVHGSSDFVLSGSESIVRQRCYECFRPHEQCFCHAIPQVDNRTDILILQHIRESRHSFNTARIVHKALRRSQMISGDTPALARTDLSLAPDAGLLYPLDGAPCLSELPADQRPSQLVIIDGTWHQAKTIVRDVHQLAGLRCFRLTPAAPSQYRIRLEPNEFSVSTLEATVAALEALEPETAGVSGMLEAFNCMVENQLQHRGSRVAARLRQRKKSGPRHFPRDLRGPLERLVVAYGEENPGRKGERKGVAAVVNWEAQRLNSGERFSCCLKPMVLPSEAAMQHMQLTRSDLEQGATVDEFCQRWNEFRRPDDVLIVYHERTARMLDRFAFPQVRSLVLKALYGQRGVEFHSLDELMRAEGLAIPEPDGSSRAVHRLRMAVALTEHLMADG